MVEGGAAKAEEEGRGNTGEGVREERKESLKCMRAGQHAKGGCILSSDG